MQNTVAETINDLIMRLNRVAPIESHGWVIKMGRDAYERFCAEIATLRGKDKPWAIREFHSTIGLRLPVEYDPFMEPTKLIVMEEPNYGENP